MKKLFIILTFVFAILFNGYSFGAENNLDENVAQVVHAISLYKQKNYLQCICDLKEYIEKHPKSAAAHYYLGSSYMRLGMLTEAKEHYAQTADINTVLQMTSYSLQAIDCIDKGSEEPCVYYALNKKQIVDLIQDPTTYLDGIRNNILSEEVREGSDPEIEDLINGKYPENLHPDAVKFLLDERDKQKQFNLNKKAMLPMSSKIAKAMKYSVHSFAPSSNSSKISADEMNLIIMSETAALNK